MQQEMHPKKSENSGCNIIENDSGALGKSLQLPHRGRFDDIEDSKKNKTRQQRFPRERDGDQRYDLPGDLIDDDELRIFRGRGPGYASGSGDAHQRDQNGQGDGHRSPPGGR
jgi:hypothetical protein